VKWRSGQARNASPFAAEAFRHSATAIGPDLTWPGFWDILQVKLSLQGAVQLLRSR